LLNILHATRRVSETHADALKQAIENGAITAGELGTRRLLCCGVIDPERIPLANSLGSIDAGEEPARRAAAELKAGVLLIAEPSRETDGFLNSPGIGGIHIVELGTIENAGAAVVSVEILDGIRVVAKVVVGAGGQGEICTGREVRKPAVVGPFRADREMSRESLIPGMRDGREDGGCSEFNTLDRVTG